MASTPTIRAPRSGAPSSNGHRPDQALGIAPPRRRVRMPELVIGVMVMTAFALGAVMWHLSAVDKSPALAVVGSVERGETISASDVHVVYVASDNALARLTEADLNTVVGRVALVDLAPGTLLTRSVVADRPALEDGDGIVGLSLEPGGYPAMGLSPGDLVNVVRTVDPADPISDTTADDTTDDDDTDEASSGSGSTRTTGTVGDVVIARGATVVSVEELSSDRLLVSILAPEGEAVAVAARAGSGSLRLVQVSP